MIHTRLERPVYEAINNATSKILGTPAYVSFIFDVVWTVDWAVAEPTYEAIGLASKRKVDCVSAFLQGKQRLVDLCSVHLRLLICVHSVSSSLVACKIDETHLAVLSLVVLEAERQNRV